MNHNWLLRYSALTTNLILPADAAEWMLLLPDGTARTPATVPGSGSGDQPQLAIQTTVLELNTTLCLRLSQPSARLLLCH